jgi:hypothetical protein
MAEQDYSVHPYAAWFPMLDDDGLARLANDIRENGQRLPILLDREGKVVDGRNRLAACRMAGVPPWTETTDDDPARLVASLNIVKRHLTVGQQAMGWALAYPDPSPVGRGKKGSATEPLSKSKVSEARTVRRYAPELIVSVMAGGSLDQAYQIALSRKQQDDREQEAFAQLERNHPDLAARVRADEWSLMEALAAARGLEQGRAEQERQNRYREDIRLAAEAIGPEVPIPTPPDLTLSFTTNDEGETSQPKDQPGQDTESLRAQKRFLDRLIAIKRDLESIAASPPMASAWWPEGQVMAVRSSVSQMVAAAYRIADTYNRRLADDQRTPLREVK